MTIEPIIFFDLTAALFFLGISLCFIVVHNSKTLQKLLRELNEKRQVQATIDDEHAALIRNAQKQAEDIIEEAGQKAAEIIRKADLGIIDSKRIISDEIKNTSSHQTTLFKEELTALLHSYMQEMENIKKQNLDGFRTILASIEKNSSETVTDYQTLLQNETLSSQKIAEEKINTAFSKAESDIAEYKKMKTEKIDHMVQELVEEMAKRILGKSFTEEDHQTLILQSLRDAKDAGLLKVENI